MIAIAVYVAFCPIRVKISVAVRIGTPAEAEQKHQGLYQQNHARRNTHQRKNLLR